MNNVVMFIKFIFFNNEIFQTFLYGHHETDDDDRLGCCKLGQNISFRSNY